MKTTYPTVENNGTAFLSIDNTRTFEDAQLNELYVQGGEQVAKQTKEIIEICKQYGVLIINVFDAHPKGHISFASSYQNKQPFDTISYDEIKDWTDEHNDLSSSAQFSVSQLKSYLQHKPGQTDRLRPDHAKDRTDSKDLMEPLTQDMFHIHMPKGHQIDKHPYGGFKDTDLSDILTQNKIHTVLITGVATDYCVGQSVQEALDDNRTTYLLTDGIAAIDPQSGEAMKQQLQQNGANLITTSQLHHILQHH